MRQARASILHRAGPEVLMFHPLLSHAVIAAGGTTLQPAIDFFHHYPCCAILIIIVVLLASRRIIAIVTLALLAAFLKVLVEAVAGILLTRPLLDYLSDLINL
jgi:hypothetical protein